MSHNDFFDINIKALKVGGIWIPNQNSPWKIRLFYYCYNTFNVFYAVFLFTTLEFVVVPESSKDRNDLMKNLSMGIMHLFTGVKVFTWFYYRKDILSIIDTLRKNAMAYEPIGDFQPSEIIAQDKKVKDRFTWAFLIFASFTGLSACLYTFLTLFTDYEKNFVYVDIGNNETKRIFDAKLPYYSYIFWDHKKSRFHFGMAVLFQCYPVFSYGVLVVGFDSLYAGIISYTSCQLKILQGAFRTVRPRCLRRFGLSPYVEVLWDVDIINQELNKELVKSIKALQIIFVICEKLEKMFSQIILVQVMGFLVIFSASLYTISEIPFNDQRVFVEIVYMIAIELQFALYCYFGNKVTVRSEDIPLALYEGDWFSTDRSFKKSMLITMTRMRRPIYFTIGGYSPLTLATFVTIARASYSFFAVLKNSS